MGGDDRERGTSGKSDVGAQDLGQENIPTPVGLTNLSNAAGQWRKGQRRLFCEAKASPCISWEVA